MNHCSQEDLILYYYGEAGDAAATAAHLEQCAPCREAYGNLQRVLNVVGAAPVPDPGAEYGRLMWRRLEPSLGRRRWGIPFWAPRRWAAIAAMAALVVAAFFAGRYSPRPPRQVAGSAPAPQQVRDRVLLVAMGDYLERSQMVLVELVNTRAHGPVDISREQERAEDLVNETRLYRQTAADTGETAMAGLLDELERVLLDIARGPAEMTGPELERIRARIEAAGILFKIRVVGSTVKQREQKTAKTQL